MKYLKLGTESEVLQWFLQARLQKGVGYATDTKKVIWWDVTTHCIKFSKVGNEQFNIALNANGAAPSVNVQYSLDGEIWNDYTIGTTLSNLDVLYMRGYGNSSFAYARNPDSISSAVYHKFEISGGQVNCSGNIMYMLDYTKDEHTMGDYAFYNMFRGCTSLVSAPDLPATTLAIFCYGSMFRGCTSLVNAPELPATTLTAYCYCRMFYGCTSLVSAPVLPATTLVYNCYQYMFEDCTSLVNAPVLPATTLADNCYDDMFYGCTSLVSAPALPATTLAAYCYEYMFYGCTSLVSAPELPATTLVYNCYANMFYGCTGLVSAPALPATTLADRCYYYMFYNCTGLNDVTIHATDIDAISCLALWLNGVSASGIFRCKEGVNYPSGSSGIPSGWTRVNI